MNLLELDFEKAKARHIAFKTNLRLILYGAEIDERSVISHEECAVGKWIYGHALQAYGHIPEMNELEKVHQQIHVRAQDLIAIYRNGEVEAAREGLLSVELIAANLVTLLTVIEMKVKGEGNLPSDQLISEDVSVNYQELLQLQSALNELDKRINFQTQQSLQAKKRADESESRFRTTMMQAPVGITILRGTDLVVEMANDAYLQIVDKREDELVGKPLLDSLPEVWDTAAPILLGVLKTGIPYYGNEFEITLKRAGVHEKCYFNFVYQPLLENEREISGVIVVATEVTKQVEGKRMLQERENQFRNLVTQSQFAKAIFRGRDMVISVANESLLNNLWRRELKDVEGRRLLDVFPELNDQKFPVILREVFETGKTYRENEALAYIGSHDGLKRYYLDYQYAPMFEIDGTVSGIMVSVNDVTEKVEFRQQIAESEERLKLATEGTQLATWDLNLQTRSIIYSERLVGVFGYPPEKVLTHWDMRDQIHPDDLHTIVEKAFAAALKTGIYYYEARLVHPDKTIHWIRTRGKVIFDENKLPLRMLGTMMDITEEKEAELSLKTSEGKFRTLADSMPQFVWTGDRQGRLNYFNRSVYDYSGLTPEQIEKDGWLQIVHPDDHRENIKLWMEAVSTGKDFLFEHRFRRHDGAYRWQLSRAIPQMDANGQIQMWVGTSTDIHDRKLFIDELELKVQQRTRELTVLNDELLRTNIELGQFAYVASHDLQEPLRKIQTFATRILETESGHLTERGKDYFNRMQASSTRMQQLITDLLAFSRANAVEKHFEETDLNFLLENVKDQLLDTIQLKNATINASALPTLKVIVYQFEQLFTNLIANALKFTRAGVSPIITIQAEIVKGATSGISGLEPDTNYHCIIFADNGIGFDPQFTERIFQVFQRLHSKNAYEGTGIGLAICKKIVDNHHGLITANGNPGLGSSFAVYIPAAL